MIKQEQQLAAMKAEREQMQHAFDIMSPSDHARFTSERTMQNLDRQIENLEQWLDRMFPERR